MEGEGNGGRGKGRARSSHSAVCLTCRSCLRKGVVEEWTPDICCPVVLSQTVELPLEVPGGFRGCSRWALLHGAEHFPY